MSKRLLVLAAVLSLAIAAYATGLYEYAQPSALRDWLLGLGPWGPLVFVLAYILGQTLQVPGSVFMVAAALTWSAPVAFLAAWIGGSLAGLPGFLLTRYVAHDWVQAHLPARFSRYDAQLTRGGVRAVIVLRLLLATSPQLPPALALTKVRAYQLVLGSAIGLCPTTLFWVLAGPDILTWALRLPVGAWIAVAALLVLGGLLGLRHWTRRRLTEQPGDA